MYPGRKIDSYRRLLGLVHETSYRQVSQAIRPRAGRIREMQSVGYGKTHNFFGKCAFPKAYYKEHYFKPVFPQHEVEIIEFFSNPRSRSLSSTPANLQSRRTPSVWP